MTAEGEGGHEMILEHNNSNYTVKCDKTVLTI